jgi:hypothetical protein
VAFALNGSFLWEAGAEPGNASSAAATPAATRHLVRA